MFDLVHWHKAWDLPVKIVANGLNSYRPPLVSKFHAFTGIYRNQPRKIPRRPEPRDRFPFGMDF